MAKNIDESISNSFEALNLDVELKSIYLTMELSIKTYLLMGWSYDLINRMEEDQYIINVVIKIKRVYCVNNFELAWFLKEENKFDS